MVAAVTLCAALVCAGCAGRGSATLEATWLSPELGRNLEAEEDLNGWKLSARVGGELLRWRRLMLDLAAGPTAIAGEHQGFGVEASARVRARVACRLEAYVEASHGVLGLPREWPSQRSRHAFVTGFGAGLLFALSDMSDMSDMTRSVSAHSWVQVGYALVHVSNGAGLGLAKEPNEGWESGGVTAGLVWRF